jgi:hypothetical protein
MTEPTEGTEFDLGTFLAHQTAGGALDSEGDFTVDTEKAAKKLARFALPDEYSWVLKVVQAAVRWQCGGIQVQQGRICTSFVFTPDDKAAVPSARQVVETILRGSLESQDPMSQFCISLRSLVEQTGLSFVLGLNRIDSELETLFAGPDVSAMPTEARKLWGILDQTGIRLTVSHQLRGEFYTGRYARLLLPERRDVKIAEMLIKRACFSPIPLTLDGRSLTNLLEHPDLGFSKTFRPLFSLALNGLEEAEPLKLDRPLETRDFPLFESRLRASQREPSQETAEAWCLWQTELLSPLIDSEGITKSCSRVIWVRDGIVVEEKRLRLTLRHNQMTLLINAAGIESDLTGLALLESVEKIERLKRVLSLARLVLRRKLKKLEEIIDFEFQEPNDSERTENWRKKRKSLFLQASSTLPLFKLHPLLGLGTMAGGLFLHGVNWLFPHKEISDQKKDKYLEDLRQDIRLFLAMPWNDPTLD